MVLSLTFVIQSSLQLRCSRHSSNTWSEPLKNQLLEKGLSGKQIRGGVSHSNQSGKAWIAFASHLRTQNMTRIARNLKISWWLFKCKTLKLTKLISTMLLLTLKRDSLPKSNIHIWLLKCSPIYPYRLFRCWVAQFCEPFHAGTIFFLKGLHWITAQKETCIYTHSQ